MDPITQQPQQSLPSTPPVQQPDMQPPQKQGRGKMLFILLGIVILLAVAGVTYYLGATKSPSSQESASKLSSQTKTTLPTATPTPDPTASWKTFTNPTGYSIKYPPTLKVQISENPYNFVSLYPQNSNGSVLPTFLIAVISDTFVAKDLAAYNYMSADWINNISNLAVGETKTMDSAAKFTRLMDMQIDGVDGVSIKVQAAGYNQVRTYVKKNGNIYMISNYYQDSNAIADFTLFASTFKFTK